MTTHASTRTARDEADAVAGARDLRARAARPAPGADRRAQPGAQRDRLARRGAGPGRGGRGRRAPGPGAESGPLHGLPFAFKDTHDVAGWRTTYGSPLLRRPRARARRPGGRADPPRRASVVIGRTNVPEFAAGSHTFNRGLRHHPQPGRPAAAPPAGPAGERPARWRPGWCRWPTGPTWAARCATRRRSAASSGCGPRSAGCPSGRSTTSGRRPRSAGRWPATSATSRCCSR